MSFVPEFNSERQLYLPRLVYRSVADPGEGPDDYLDDNADEDLTDYL